MTILPVARRQLIFGAGLAAAVVLPAGIYGVPRLMARDADGARGDYLPPLDNDETLLVAAIAEGIIPATDTPGAIGAAVPGFIAMLFADWMMKDEQESFRTGLKSFDADARSRFGKAFQACSAAQQLELLTAWDKAAATARAGGSHDLPPFAKFKSLTLVGYYTSAVGQEQELQTTMDAGQDDPEGAQMMPLPFKL